MDVNRRIEELKSLYGERVQSKALPDSTLVRIERVPLPAGCKPTEIDFLLVLNPNQETPAGRYVREQITLANGSTPALGSTLVDGETWYTYSYNFPWNPGRDRMYQFVESALTRFAKSA